MTHLSRLRIAAGLRAGVRSWRRSVVALLLILVSLQGLAQQVHSNLPRHPLEDKALEQPIEALSEIEKALVAAPPGSLEQVTLLLAKANACRVLANWECQRDAGLQAAEAADAIGQTLLAVRGQIAEARGRFAIQDFARGEQVLGSARAKLERVPDAELLADIYLAMSSMSDRIGKHALAIESAEKGLKALGNVKSPGIEARLWRNLARSRGFLGDNEQARAALSNGRAVIETMRDPKLAAELDLELARLARSRGDAAEQVSAGTRILGLADKLKNSQLEGLGQEVLGLAAMDLGNWNEAITRLRLAYRSFDSLKLERDALRVLRDLVRLEADHGHDYDTTRRLVHELIERERDLDRQERAQAGEDFDAQLKYAQQNFELQRLEAEAALAKAREQSSEDRERLNLAVLAMTVLGLLSLGVLFVQQRRSNRTLADALAQKQRSEKALEASERLLRNISDQTPALIAYLDRECRYQFVNAHYRSVFRADPNNMIGQTVAATRTPELYAQIKPHIDQVLAGERADFESSGIDDGGVERFFRVSYVPDRAPDGEIRGFYSLAFDVTAMKLAERKLEELSRTDALTGLPNRRWFDLSLRTALSRNQRHHQGLALLYLDIDHFKQINDRYGHSAGDQVIREFAQRLRQSIRTEDLVARIGGDEFVIIAEDCAAVDDARHIAEKLLKAMEAPMQIDIYAIRCHTSIGIAWLQNVEDSNVAIKLADDALYAAKAAGRNTFAVAGQ
ncbi:GGDEF domain-containing protein [Ahniella affigens]|nr:GGDEF domain-containing protein [Ahniella affigens]